MRLIFCGSGDFGIPTLLSLASAGHEVLSIYTQPARPAGRGGKLRPTPVAEQGEKMGLPVCPVADINAPEVVEAMRSLHPEALLVIDFGQMIGDEVCNLAEHGAVNLHGSLLPELRGAAPVNWAILRGHEQTGVTTFRIVKRMDAGAMFVKKATAIDKNETAQELRYRLADLGVEAVAETLALFAAGRQSGQEQDESLATKAPRLKKTDGTIDWSADAEAIRRLVHGTWPWPGGHTDFVSEAGKRQTVELGRVAALPQGGGGAPGVLGDDLTVACGTGRIAIVQIKPAGGRLMPWQDFVNGHRVRPGCRFEKTAEMAK
jgi:methionyl-tRNA formyltransferase